MLLLFVWKIMIKSAINLKYRDEVLPEWTLQKGPYLFASLVDLISTLFTS